MNVWKIIIAIILLAGLGVAIAFGYVWYIESKEGATQTTQGIAVGEPSPVGDSVVSSATTTITESVVEFEKNVAVTPDDQYQYGAFCRVDQIPNQDNFLVTFGGSNRDVQALNAGSPFGGAEGGNGYSYKIYDSNFEYEDRTGVVHNGGGDAASVMADGYYYFLIGTPPRNWIIEKFDPSTMMVVDSVVIEMDKDKEILNDMMLAYANGNIIASGLYDASGTVGGDQKKSDPTAGMATHYHTFDTDLNFKERFVLDDVPHINGSYVVFANNKYNVITSTAFFGDLIVMQYDSDWNFISSKVLDEDAQWSQGALFDDATGRFYVAFLDIPLTADNKIVRGKSIDVVLGIFDQDWNLIEKVNVTGLTPADMKNPGRPSVVLVDGKLYVSYDVSTASQLGQSENMDWQCTVDIFEVK